MKPAKILYFIDGPAPSAANFMEAAELSANVVFRNARAVPSEAHSLEICDGVAGKVPPIYANRFPPAAEAIAKKKAELKALTSKVGDAPAPKPAGAAQGAGKGTAPASGQKASTQPQTQPQTAKPAAWNPNPAQ